jgi:hypothetical protein
MRCIWCSYETTTDKSAATDQVRFANKEHIFPEAVGGQRCLTQGLVCEICNRELGGTVDRFLKTGDFSMMNQFQISDGLPGKRGDAARRERKKKEKRVLHHHNKSTLTCRSDDGENTLFLNVNYYQHEPKFIRALHKCLANVIVDVLGSDYFAEHHRVLKNYVLTGEPQLASDWAVGIAYATMAHRKSFEPFHSQLLFDGDGKVIAGVLLFPSLLAIVGTEQNAITRESLWRFTRLLHKEFSRSHKNGLTWDVVQYFQAQGVLDTSNREPLHSKLQVRLVKKHVSSAPLPGKIQVLVPCPCCGQANPTGITYQKSEVLSQSNKMTSGRKTSWNAYEREDMPLILGPMAPESLDPHFEKYSKASISIGTDKLNAMRCNWSSMTLTCIGCDAYIYAQPKDYFF